MRLTGLEPLYRSMRSQGIERYKFPYQVRHLHFDCLFYIDTDPFELVLGCKGENFAIFVKVERGFVIDPVIDNDVYHKLRKALHYDGASGNKLRMSDFFKEFNERIPTHADPRQRATSGDIAPYRSHVEEADKIYFCGWRDNSARGEHVTERNLEKTREWLGRRAYEFAKRRNQSTCWTADKGRSVEFAVPDEVD